MIRATESEWLSNGPVFLLDLTWGAKTYRFSTQTLSITKGNESIQYLGKLDTFDYDLKLQRFGYDGEGDSVPFAINFPVDIAKQHNDGNPIDGAIGEISFVLLDAAGNVAQNYDSRILLFRGVVSSPVYGHPNEPAGYVEFSLESKAIIERVSLLDAVVGLNGRIDAADLSNEDKASLSPFTDIISGGIIDVSEVHRGKRNPIVIGKPGKVISRTSTAALTSVPMSPGYTIGISPLTSSNKPMFILIAGHRVESSSVVIFDSEGNNTTANVGTFVGSENNIFSFATVFFHPSAPIKSSLVDESVEYWVSWIDDDGGGLPSPFSSGVLENGGEICLWALSKTGARIDYDSWNAVIPLLKRYKFAGFINDPEVEPIQFLESEILPFLPISITIGPRGIKPVPNLRILGSQILEDFGIVAGSTFRRASPISSPTSTGELINQVDINYSLSGKNNRYLGSIRITPKPRNRNYEYSNDYSVTSHQLFGLKSATFSANFVYDYFTANQIARDKIREFALPKRTIQYEAAPAFGFVNIGDIIALTDSDIYLEEMKCQIISKKWTGSSWLFTLEIEQNKIVNR